MAEQGIFDTLIKEHREAADLLEKLEQTDSEDHEARQSLLRELSTALVSHNEAESRTLYESLTRFNEMTDSVREHQQEHDEVNSMLAKLVQMDTDDEQWPSKLKTIHENVEHHVDDEENELFPQARKLLDKEEVNDLQDRFEQEKEKAKSNMR